MSTEFGGLGYGLSQQACTKKYQSVSTAHARTHAHIHTREILSDETINRVYAACDKITYAR